MAGFFLFILAIFFIIFILGAAFVRNILQLLFRRPTNRGFYSNTNTRNSQNRNTNSSDSDANSHKKVFSKDEGEYVDYEEVKTDY